MQVTSNNATRSEEHALAVIALAHWAALDCGEAFNAGHVQPAFESHTRGFSAPMVERIRAILARLGYSF